MKQEKISRDASRMVSRLEHLKEGYKKALLNIGNTPGSISVWRKKFF